MKINPKEIINAWITSFNPSADEKSMAEKREKICLECPSYNTVFKDKTWSAFCGECGCPISKKVYTKEYNACPLKKWENVDNDYFSKHQAKSKSSII